MKSQRKNEMIVIVDAGKHGRPVFALLIVDGRCMRRKGKVCMDITWKFCKYYDVLLIEFKSQEPIFKIKSLFSVALRVWPIGKLLQFLFQQIDADKITSLILALASMWEWILDLVIRMC